MGAALLAVAPPMLPEMNDTPLQDRIGPWLVERSLDLESPGVPVICTISQASVRLTFYGGALAQVELDRPVGTVTDNATDDIGTNISVRSLRLDRRTVRILHRRSLPPTPDDGRPYINDPVTVSTFSLDGQEWHDLQELPASWRAGRWLAVIGERGRRIATISLSRFAEAAGRCGN